LINLVNVLNGRAKFFNTFKLSAIE